MIKYSIEKYDKNGKPAINFPQNSEYWILCELNSCSTDYILDEVLPNIEKIWNGEKYWDPYRSPIYGAFDTYEFGYTAIMIEFGKEVSLVDDSWDDNFVPIEVSSEEIYLFMKEWGEELLKWKNENR